MITDIKHYSDLTKDEFHDIVALRIAVFVVEQDCPYQELDGLDKDAYHLIIKEGNQTLGTTRILKKGIVYPEVAIGRVVSSPQHRHLKIGHHLMEMSMKYIIEELNESAVRLSAQSHLVNYYGKYGFKSTGKEYLEDGIPHTEMLFKS